MLSAAFIVFISSPAPAVIVSVSGVSSSGSRLFVVIGAKRLIGSFRRKLRTRFIAVAAAEFLFFNRRHFEDGREPALAAKSGRFFTLLVRRLLRKAVEGGLFLQRRPGALFLRPLL